MFTNWSYLIRHMRHFWNTPLSVSILHFYIDAILVSIMPPLRSAARQGLALYSMSAVMWDSEMFLHCS